MRKMIACTVLALALAGFAGAAEAKGCIKGAVVGGIAGHAVGHTFAGAAAGCAIGRHQANKRQRDRDTAGQPATR
ncbi:hypothetical protein [Methylobacterium frigidaeris]|uniref:Glycine zipper 2TM domain-containing protein n=1 Tax=Methylobacterium frigidaeris TaxID=2038277 RepID=A0AA37M4V7_9HYPH|nr:hypothetical protein [Methylobacterium frigidaeris]PIK73932.1 hypothetical protein CS379_05440 [Methylobacterium frigidaeris]GJD62694.1 hypothetical protein MPEAHAMD_2851 [Methylobacterium frigidaeris]